MELEEGMAVFETMTTIELKINFLKPVWNTKLQAVAKIIKKGSTIGLLECHVYDEKTAWLPILQAQT